MRWNGNTTNLKTLKKFYFYLWKYFWKYMAKTYWCYSIRKTPFQSWEKHNDSDYCLLGLFLCYREINQIYSHWIFYDMSHLLFSREIKNLANHWYPLVGICNFLLENYVDLKFQTCTVKLHTIIIYYKSDIFF